MRLGDMSYSIYLHGLVLDAAFSSPTIVQVALSSSAAYWLVILVFGAVLVCVSTLSLVLIERPGVLLGRRVGARATMRSEKESASIEIKLEAGTTTPARTGDLLIHNQAL